MQTSKVGIAFALAQHPVRTTVHNVERCIRAKAGSSVPLCRGWCTVDGQRGKLRDLAPSLGEFRMVHQNCRATVGQVGNVEHENITIGKSGSQPLVGSAAPGFAASLGIQWTTPMAAAKDAHLWAGQRLFHLGASRP